MAQSEIAKLVARHQAYSARISQLFTATLAKYGIVANDTPPVIAVASAVQIPVGAKPFQLPISDVETPLKDPRKSRLSPNRLKRKDWLTSCHPKAADTGVTAIIDTKTSTQRKATRHKIDYTVADTGPRGTVFQV